MDDLLNYKDILLGPAGTAFVLLMFWFYYMKYFKPSEDKRQDERDARFWDDHHTQQETHRNDIASQRTEFRADIERIINDCETHCKEELSHVTEAYQRHIEDMRLLMNAVIETIKNNTAAIQSNTEQGRRMIDLQIYNSTKGNKMSNVTYDQVLSMLNRHGGTVEEMAQWWHETYNYIIWPPPPMPTVEALAQYIASCYSGSLIQVP
jgi:hypothetical protein